MYCLVVAFSWNLWKCWKMSFVNIIRWNLKKTLKMSVSQPLCPGTLLSCCLRASSVPRKNYSKLKIECNYFKTALKIGMCGLRHKLYRKNDSVSSISWIKMLGPTDPQPFYPVWRFERVLKYFVKTFKNEILQWLRNILDLHIKV